MRSRRNVLIFGAAVVVVLALTALTHQIVAPRDVIDEKNIIAEETYRLSDTHPRRSGRLWQGDQLG